MHILVLDILLKYISSKPGKLRGYSSIAGNYGGIVQLNILLGNIRDCSLLVLGKLIENVVGFSPQFVYNIYYHLQMITYLLNK